jgi:hypothetical protein
MLPLSNRQSWTGASIQIIRVAVGQARPRANQPLQIATEHRQPLGKGCIAQLIEIDLLYPIPQRFHIIRLERSLKELGKIRGSRCCQVLGDIGRRNSAEAVLAEPKPLATPENSKGGANRAHRRIGGEQPCLLLSWDMVPVHAWSVFPMCATHNLYSATRRDNHLIRSQDR